MAGEWIKMRGDLQTHPKVVRILSALRTDRLHVVGALHAVWSIFDQHSEDGILDGYSCDALDSMIGFPGFANAMVGVQWLELTGDGLKLPEFSTHNGQSAKRRATESSRKRVSRESAQSVGNPSASDADKKRLREEKREEDKKPPIAPLKGAPSISFKTFIEACKDKNEKAISDYKPLWDYVDKVGIPRDWVALAWRMFGRNHSDGTKRYKDWRKAFRLAVERNYLKLWYFDAAGQVLMSSTGFAEQKHSASEDAA